MANGWVHIRVGDCRATHGNVWQQRQALMLKHLTITLRDRYKLLQFLCLVFLCFFHRKSEENVHFDYMLIL